MMNYHLLYLNYIYKLLDYLLSKLDNLFETEVIPLRIELTAGKKYDSEKRGYKFALVYWKDLASTNCLEMSNVITLGTYVRGIANSSLTYYNDGILGCGQGTITISRCIFFN